MITCLSPNGGVATLAPAPASRLMVATIAGIAILERDGPDQAWQLSGYTLQGFHISSLLYEPRSGRLVAGTHGGRGLWTSDDQGGSWTKKTRGLERPHVYMVTAQYRGDQVVLFAGVEPAALYRSDDLGESWYDLPSLCDVPDTEHWTFPPPPHIAHVKNLAFHPSAPEVLYVCVEQGALLTSVDDGKSWKELTSYLSSDDRFYRDTHRVAIRPSNPDHIYLATGDGLYASTDAGTSWRHLTKRSDRIGYPDALFFDPRNEDVLYMAGAGDAPEDWRQSGVSNAGVIRSLDRGVTWQELGNGLPQPMVGNIEAMGYHLSASDLLLLAGTATGQVYASEDGGETWQCIADGLSPISKAGHFRWFLSEQARLRIEGEMRAWKDAASE